MKRSWVEPRAKLDSENGCCRVCGQGPVDPAHIIPRSRVAPGPGEEQANVVPLCRSHHAAFDRHEFDLLPYLTFEEQAYAASLVGLFEAFRRITGKRLFT